MRLPLHFVKEIFSALELVARVHLNAKGAGISPDSCATHRETRWQRDRHF